MAFPGFCRFGALKRDRGGLQFSTPSMALSTLQNMAFWREMSFTGTKMWGVILAATTTQTSVI